MNSLLPYTLDSPPPHNLLLHQEMWILTITITVKFMSIARQHAGAGVVQFTSPHGKLRDVLKAIVGAYRIADLILTESGEVRQWARVLVNGRSHELIGGLDIELHNGDSVALIYPYTENF